MLIHAPYTPTRDSARVLLAMLGRPTTIYQELASALLSDFGPLEMQKEIVYRLVLQHAKRSPNIRHEVEASDIELRYENEQVHCVVDEKKILARLTRWLLNEQAKEEREPDAFLRETIADLAASQHWAKGEPAVVELQAGLVIRLDPPGGFGEAPDPGRRGSPGIASSTARNLQRALSVCFKGTQGLSWSMATSLRGVGARRTGDGACPLLGTCPQEVCRSPRELSQGLCPHSFVDPEALRCRG